MKNYMNLDRTEYSDKEIAAWDTIYENLENIGYVPQYSPETKKATIVYSSVFNHIMYNLTFYTLISNPIKELFTKNPIYNFKVKIEQRMPWEPVYIALEKTNR